MNHARELPIIFVQKKEEGKMDSTTEQKRM